MLLLKAISITIKKMNLLHLHAENNYQFGGGLTADVKIFKCLNRLMNLDPQMKSKRFRQKKRTLKIYTEPQEV